MIGGKQGECEKENGRRVMEPRRKGLRHLSTAGLARRFWGLGWLVGWLAGWLGWAELGDVELELDQLTQGRPPAADRVPAYLGTECLLYIHPGTY